MNPKDMHVGSDSNVGIESTGNAIRPETLPISSDSLPMEPNIQSGSSLVDDSTGHIDSSNCSPVDSSLERINSREPSSPETTQVSLNFRQIDSPHGPIHPQEVAENGVPSNVIQVDPQLNNSGETFRHETPPPSYYDAAWRALNASGGDLARYLLTLRSPPPPYSTLPILASLHDGRPPAYSPIHLPRTRSRPRSISLFNHRASQSLARIWHTPSFKNSVFFSLIAIILGAIPCGFVALILAVSGRKFGQRNDRSTAVKLWTISRGVSVAGFFVAVMVIVTCAMLGGAGYIKYCQHGYSTTEPRQCCKHSQDVASCASRGSYQENGCMKCCPWVSCPNGSFKNSRGCNECCDTTHCVYGFVHTDNSCPECCPPPVCGYESMDCDDCCSKCYPRRGFRHSQEGYRCLGHDNDLLFVKCEKLSLYFDFPRCRRCCRNRSCGKLENNTDLQRLRIFHGIGL